MIAIGFGLVWAGYGIGFWGISLIKGWDLSPKMIWSPTGYYAAKWPPPLAPPDQIIPNGSGALTAGEASGGPVLHKAGGKLAPGRKRS